MKASLENFKNTLIENFKNYKKPIILGILFFFTSVAVGGFITYKIMKDQVDAAYEKIEDLKTTLPNAEVAAQLRIVKDAVEDLKKNKPVTERVVNNNQTEIRYVEKESPEDADVDIQDQAPVARIKYNDQTYDVPMQTTTSHTTDKDGTVKVNQAHELTIDVTKVADRQIAAYQLSMEDKQRELNDELKKVKHENKTMKFVGGAVALTGTAYLINKALK
jgi:hypothetical protein|nr:MAG TPA: hypothetical protein [Caudoviricetes sp.]